MIRRDMSFNTSPKACSNMCDCKTWPPPFLRASIRKSPGQAARTARRRGNREQEVVGSNSKTPVRDERKKQQESLQVKL